MLDQPCHATLPQSEQENLSQFEQEIMAMHQLHQMHQMHHPSHLQVQQASFLCMHSFMFVIYTVIRCKCTRCTTHPISRYSHVLSPYMEPIKKEKTTLEELIT